MPERMLTIDELSQMTDISGPALYRAEVRRIPIIPRDEQPAYIEAARNSEEAAGHELILNCLNWTMSRAAAICRDRPPEHSDMMDLVGQANVKMVETMPNALAAKDPVAYLMSVSAWEMQRYRMYHDPLIKRPKDKPPDTPHPGTVSLDTIETPASQEIPPPDIPEYKIVHKALGQLGKRQRIVLMAAYGLNGGTRQRNEDIAAMLHMSKQTVEVYLWRAKKRLAAKLAPYLGELGLREN